MIARSLRFALPALVLPLPGCGLFFTSRPCSVAAYAPVFAQATSGDITAVRAALDSNPRLIRARECDRSTLLHDAVEHEETAMADFLLDRGARVDARTRSGLTPLHIAAQNGDLATIGILLRHGASIDAADHEGRTALDRAVEWQHPEAADMLRSRGGRRR